VTALRWLGRGLATALTALSRLLMVGPGSARRAILDRWDERATRLFPSSAERHRDHSDEEGGGWAP
jgi:hypothetical protein